MHLWWDLKCVVSLDYVIPLLDTFCEASGMCINSEKSCFLFNNVDDGSLNRITRSLPYKTEHISSGFNYVGYFIKPMGYMVKDWFWLIKKFEKKDFPLDFPAPFYGG